MCCCCWWIFFICRKAGKLLLLSSHRNISAVGVKNWMFFSTFSISSGWTRKKCTRWINLFKAVMEFDTINFHVLCQNEPHNCAFTIFINQLHFKNIFFFIRSATSFFLFHFTCRFYDEYQTSQTRESMVKKRHKMPMKKIRKRNENQLFLKQHFSLDSFLSF